MSKLNDDLRKWDLGFFVLGVCLAVSMLFNGCNIFPIRPTPLPDDVTIEQVCTAACDNMTGLKYPGYAGTPSGVSCAEVCIKQETGIPPFPFHGRCIAAASSHEEMDECYGD